MKKLLITFLLAILMVTGMSARTFVLVTGISNYNDPNNNLEQPTKDAKRFKEVMESQTKDITILTSSNVTKANVLEKLSAICNRAQKEDQVVFFYAGHGMKGGLYAYDQPIPYSDIVRMLSKSKAGSKLAFIDACHAGTVVNPLNNTDWSSTVTGSGDIAFFVGCRPEEGSLENPFIGAGLFTQALIKGMRGKSDKNADKRITVEELFRYAYNDVLVHSGKKQHPQLIAPKNMYNVVVTKW
ncbi:MAG: caspase family protein [Muribaculaceae bacterium]|nr:caspase family protein [Muribaculaceae bacterium]